MNQGTLQRSEFAYVDGFLLAIAAMLKPLGRNLRSQQLKLASSIEE